MAKCRSSRSSGKLLAFAIMCFASVWMIVLYFCFTSCALVHVGDTRTLLERAGAVGDPGGGVYPPDLPEGSVGKRLLQESPSWQYTYDDDDDNMPAVVNANNANDIPNDVSIRFVPENQLNEPTSEDPNNDRTLESSVPRTVLVEGTKKLPQAIIIGVKKGGTRALLEFLRIHPDVRAPGPETHFFDRYYHKGLEWYREQMPPTTDGQMTIEKTPSYFITKEVPRRIFSMSPNIKLIVVVRDPVTRAISDYTQAASKRPGMKPFEHMAFLDNYTGLVNTSWGAIRIGVYAKHLDKWLKYFPLSQMHFVSGEKLITDPAGQMARVQDFLGLKRVISEKHFYFNETKGFPCLKKTEGSGRPHCLGKSKGRQHPKVGPRLLQRLRDFFRPFNAKFYQMVGQDFGWP